MDPCIQTGRIVELTAAEVTACRGVWDDAAKLAAIVAAGHRRAFGWQLADGQLIGGCALHWREADCGHLSYLVVAPAFRGRGVGGQLLDFAVAFFEQAGAARLRLHVMKDNPRAQRLYIRKGFVYAFDAAPDKMVMLKALRATPTPSGDGPCQNPPHRLPQGRMPVPITPRGILLFGAMGAGDSTLGRALAARLCWPHIDIDDYVWDWQTPIPYTRMYPGPQRIQRLLAAIEGRPHFVMSGSMFSIRQHFTPYFALAVFLRTPAAVCAERVRRRSLARWGDRVAPGGDMYQADAVYRDYLANAQSYETGGPDVFSLAQHRQWMAQLPCPVLQLDGTLPIAQNVERIAACYRALSDEKEVAP